MLKIIGSEEWCIFKDLGIPAIKARVDSGAKTSSIQASNISVIRKKKEDWVKFEVNPVQDNRSITLECEGKLVDRRIIKSSSGISEEVWNSGLRSGKKGMTAASPRRASVEVAVVCMQGTPKNSMTSEPLRS